MSLCRVRSGAGCRPSLEGTGLIFPSFPGELFKPTVGSFRVVGSNRILNLLRTGELGVGSEAFMMGVI